MAFIRSRWLALLFVCVGLLIGAGIGGAVAAYLAFFRDLPDLQNVEDYRPALASRVVDRHGEFVGLYFAERRELTPLEDVPEHVVQAFVAGEDSAFFEHSGVDFESILRAAWKNLLAGGEIRQGGSTITQQMVKGLLLTPERTIRRKIREMILARRIEERFSKQEILYLYLNQIYFGHGAYGIGQAARTYFGKGPEDLTVSEGAMLAGLPKAPSRYSPFSNPRVAEQRRRYVLERMLKDEFISQSVYEESLAGVPVLAERTDPTSFGVAGYFAEEARRRLFEELGGDVVLRGGLTIELTMDLALQRAGAEALRNGLIDHDRRQGYRGPVRAVAPDEIEAELVRLEEENGLGAPDAEELAEQAKEPQIQQAASGDEAASIEEQLSGASLLGEGPYLGVVTEIDEKGMWARVGFAPDVEGHVRLSDVAWARPPNPQRSPYKMKSTKRIFQVGDVTWFAPLALGGAEAMEGDAVLVTLHQEPIAQGALLSFEVDTDEVIAMVGGYDFEDSEFNRVTQAKRQPGSAFKPIIYASALAAEDEVYTPASILHDRPIVYVDEETGFTWRPRNYKRSFYGPITLRVALARSVNNATVHLFRDLGVDYVIDYARKLGIRSPLTRDLSLALGSSGVSLLELTRAYGVFVAGGRMVAPVFIRRVLDRNGEVLLENVRLDEQDIAPPIEDREPVIQPEEAYLAADLLRAVVQDEDGTGWRLRALRRPVGGKTGTTNDQGDAWFMGFSPGVTTGVWVGHDEKRLLGYGETGSKAAAPIWVDYMRAALRDRPRRDFEVPEPIVFARIDRETGLLADATSKETVFQSFLEGTVPTRTASAERTSTEGRRLLRMDSF